MADQINSSTLTTSDEPVPMDIPLNPPVNSPVNPLVTGVGANPLADSNLDQEVDDESEALSPFHILQQHQPNPQPSQAPLNSLSKDELVQLAATQPAQSFHLPSKEVLDDTIIGEMPPPPDPAVLRIPTSNLDLESPLSPLTSVTPPSVTPPFTPTPVAPIVSAPPVQAPPSLASMPPSPIHNATLPADTPKTKSDSRVGLYAIVGLVIGLIILGGGAYALAENGVRVPILYSKVSGLPSSGVALNQAALKKLSAYKSYQGAGELNISVQNSGKVKAPSTSLVGGSLVSHIQSQYSIADWDTQTNKVQTMASLSSDIPKNVGLGIDATADDNYLSLYFPTNISVKNYKLSTSDLKNSLLYPILVPISSIDDLNLVQKELGYQKKKVNGLAAAAYTFSVNQSSLANFLPSGAQIKSSSLEIDYVWQQELPVASSINVDFTYLSQEYVLQEAWNFGDWDLPISSANATSLAPLLTAKMANLQPISLVDTIANLGFQSNSLSTETSTANTTNSNNSPTPSPTPSPTASQTPAQATASPGIAATPMNGALVPSGGAISSLLSPLSTTPSINYSQPATSAATDRDTQRLKDLQELQKALQSYKSSVGSYPVTNGFEQTRSSESLFSALVPNYLFEMPVDPLNNSYYYAYSSDGTSYTLRAVAEDAKASGAIAGPDHYYFELKSSN
jgi:hypothetical protein